VWPWVDRHQLRSRNQRLRRVLAKLLVTSIVLFKTLTRHGKLLSLVVGNTIQQYNKSLMEKTDITQIHNIKCSGELNKSVKTN